MSVSANSQVAGFEIYVDTHEPAELVNLIKTTKIKKIDDAAIPVTRKLLECGDIAIVYNGHIICVIERKTWKDLASSIKDGRIGNEEKLQKAKADHKCHLVYLIEGRMRMADTSKVGRMPYSTLLSFMDHRAMDGYIIIQSKRWQDTAERLLQLVRSYSTRKDILDPLKTIAGGGIVELKAPEITDDRIKADIWRSMPGISHSWAGVFADGVKLVDFIRGKLSEADFTEMKNAEGRRFGPAKSKKIMELDVKVRDKNILTAMRGITPAVADGLLARAGLSVMLDTDAKTIAGWEKAGTKRKIGPKLAEKILSLNSY